LIVVRVRGDFAIVEWTGVVIHPVSLYVHKLANDRTAKSIVILQQAGNIVQATLIITGDGTMVIPSVA